MRPVRTPLSGGELATLERIVGRIANNMPRSGDPERFHLEKSEIVNALRRVAGALRQGLPLPDIADHRKGEP